MPEFNLPGWKEYLLLAYATAPTLRRFLISSRIAFPAGVRATAGGANTSADSDGLAQSTSAHFQLDVGGPRGVGATQNC